MIRNFDLAALRSFVAVVETGGVTRAAQQLHLTQSAVSMQVKRLETALGVELLMREGRGVTLTRRGEELAPQARRLLALNDEIWEQMTTPEHEGQVIFGVPHDIVYPYIPTILRRFHKDYPGIRVILVSSLSTVLKTKLASGDCDLILTTEYGCDPGGEPLVEKPLVWIGAPQGRAWRRRPIPIAFERRCAFRKHTLAALDAAGLPWVWTVDTDYYDAAMASIAADLAICTMLDGASPRGLEQIDHGGVLPEMPSLTINLYQSGGPNMGFAERLAGYVRAVVQGPEDENDRRAA